MYLLSPEEATNYQSRSIEIASTLKIKLFLENVAVGLRAV
jgi:hypothetical protein